MRKETKLRITSLLLASTILYGTKMEIDSIKNNKELSNTFTKEELLDRYDVICKNEKYVVMYYDRNIEYSYTFDDLTSANTFMNELIDEKINNGPDYTGVILMGTIGVTGSIVVLSIFDLKIIIEKEKKKIKECK